MAHSEPTQILAQVDPNRLDHTMARLDPT
jgi:hypothetical protein